MIVLGVNCVFHDSSACLLVDGVPVYAVEEERFNRLKHAKPASVDNPDHVPFESIKYCIAKAQALGRGIDAVAYSFDPQLRAERFELDIDEPRGSWGDTIGEQIFLQRLEQVPDAISHAMGIDMKKSFHWVPHHLAHAASAYYPSGFSEAGIMVVDGIGEYGTGLLGQGEGQDIYRITDLTYPNSLGFLWEKFSEFMGFTEYDACKVMGLSAYGNQKAMSSIFAEVADFNKEGLPILNRSALGFRRPGFSGLERIFKIPARQPGEEILSAHCDISAALQAYTETAVLRLAEVLFDRLGGCSNLCYAGGVALNCVANWRLKETGPFKRIFIPSAPNDAGTAIGAALLTHRQLAGQTVYKDSPYAGPDFSDVEIEAALAETSFCVRKLEDPETSAAQRLANGEVIGWFQGRMEFGPRALGNRSLLADPRSINTRDLLNRLIKHREDFRPFGPSVLAEKADEWFDLGARLSQSMSYMLFACPVRHDRKKHIPAVTHVDGTSRLQIVDRESNPAYHHLITAFERLTDIPVLLNTSFNDSEPIVCSPQDALSTYSRTSLHALYLSKYEITRSM